MTLLKFLKPIGQLLADPPVDQRADLSQRVLLAELRELGLGLRVATSLFAHKLDYQLLGIIATAGRTRFGDGSQWVRKRWRDRFRHPHAPSETTPVCLFAVDSLIVITIVVTDTGEKACRGHHARDAPDSIFH
jgi:hypothetical protein